MINENEPTLEDEKQDNGVEAESEEIIDTDEHKDIPASPALKMIQAALSGDAVEVQNSFKQAIVGKLEDILADRKQEIANTLVSDDPQDHADSEPEQTTTDANPNDDEDFVEQE